MGVGWIGSVNGLVLGIFVGVVCVVVCVEDNHIGW